MKQKIPFLIRLFVLAPAVMLASIVWAAIGVVSVESLGQVLKATGEKLLTKH